MVLPSRLLGRIIGVRDVQLPSKNSNVVGEISGRDARNCEGIIKSCNVTEGSCNETSAGVQVIGRLRGTEPRSDRIEGKSRETAGISTATSRNTGAIGGTITIGTSGMDIDGAKDMTGAIEPGVGANRGLHGGAGTAKLGFFELSDIPTDERLVFTRVA